jgi:hypothetical protein
MSSARAVIVCDARSPTNISLTFTRCRECVAARKQALFDNEKRQLISRKKNTILRLSAQQDLTCGNICFSVCQFLCSIELTYEKEGCDSFSATNGLIHAVVFSLPLAVLVTDANIFHSFTSF